VWWFFMAMTLTPDNSVEIIPAPPEFIKLLIARQYSRAGELMGVVVPQGWPDDPEAVAGLSWHLRAIERDPHEQWWRIRLIVLRLNRTVIGSINLKGMPDRDGSVEIGWGISEDYRGRGIVTRAAAAVMQWAFAQPGVKRVIATIPRNNPRSERVAERLGMKQTGELQRGLPVWAKDRVDALR
jgi:[ribosomal protein S5]-alanine N-acetyltransferase